eukprot:g3519.t1
MRVLRSWERFRFDSVRGSPRITQKKIKRLCCSDPSRFVDFSTALDYSTGFPVPVYPQSSVHQVSANEKLEVPEKLPVNPVNDGELSPVFRMEPYTAEARRREGNMNIANILVLDEGNECRSILAAAIIKKLIVESGLQSDINISAGSIGPPCRNDKNPELIQVASEMDVTIEDEFIKGKVFSESVDAIENDLILVYKDISILDTINPSGYYSSRLKLIGEFSFVCFGFDSEIDFMEIGDPWYGNMDSQQDIEALRVVGRKLLVSCKGLLTYLNMLKKKCINGLSMQVALTQSLRCPVIEQSSLARSIRMKNWKPIWKSKDSSSKEFFTVEGVGDEMKVVKLSMTHRKRQGYWQDITNVDHEIRNWMWRHQITSRLPKHHELRQTRCSSLSRAIVEHGGLHVFSKRMGIPCFYEQERKPFRYWTDLNNVEKELNDWCEKHGMKNEFPTREQLRETGANCLSVAIRYHGGIESLSILLKKKQKRHGRKYWENDTNFKNALLPFLEKGPDGHVYLPRQSELVRRNRSDLLGAIKRRGGYRKVSLLFGVKTRKRHFRSFDTFVSDLMEFMECHDLPAERLPSPVYLERHDRLDLSNEIKSFGGSRAVAKKLQWSCEL